MEHANVQPVTAYPPVDRGGEPAPGAIVGARARRGRHCGRLRHSGTRWSGVFGCVGLALGAVNNRMLQRSVIACASAGPADSAAGTARHVPRRGRARLGGITLLAIACRPAGPARRARHLRRPGRLPGPDARRRRPAGLPQPAADSVSTDEQPLPRAVQHTQHLAINITPGEHIEWHVFGVTLNGDTITATLIAGADLILLGLLIRAAASITQARPSCSSPSRPSPTRSRRRSRTRWASRPRRSSCRSR